MSDPSSSRPAQETRNKVDAEKIIHDYFTSQGFITGDISLPQLKTRVSLKNNQFFKIEERVKDVPARIRAIRKEFGLPEENTHYLRGYGWCGYIIAECCQNTAYGYIILIGHDLNEVSRVYTLGHESGHFLWYLGQQELIYQKFIKPDFVKSEIQSNSDFACLCGWAAVKMAGYNLNDCWVINIADPAKQNRSDYLKSLVEDYLKETPIRK